MWELDQDLSFAAELPVFHELSRFPAIRRDIAVLVDRTLPVARLQEAVLAAGGALLTESRIFDVYQGERIDSSLKSVAFGLILQGSSHTLTDKEVDEATGAVRQALAAELGASFRE